MNKDVINHRNALGVLYKHPYEFEGNIRNAIVEFADVSPKTVKRWLQGTQYPIGEPLVRLIYFLQFSGFRMRELEDLSGDILQLGRLIAFQVLDAKSINKYLGYSERNDIIRVIFGKAGISHEKLNKLKELVEDYSGLLEESIAKCKPLIRKNEEVRTQSRSFLATSTAGVKGVGGQAIQIDASPKRDIISGGGTEGFLRLKQQKLADHALIKSATLSMVDGLIPLAEAILSEKFSPEIRLEIIEVGSDDISRLMDLLKKVIEFEHQTADSRGGLS